MSYKTGIPLLKSFEDGNDSDDEDFTVETLSTGGGQGRCHCSRKFLCFVGVLVFAVVAVLGIAAGATVVGLKFASSKSEGETGVVQGHNESIASPTVTALPSPSPNQSVSVMPPMVTALPSPSPNESVSVMPPMMTALPSPSPNQSMSVMPPMVTASPSPSPSPSSTPTPTPACSSGSVCQAMSDLRTYEVFTLPNELRVLTISDPNSNVSAASMDVSVGSFSDPREVEGLAHFCEHMLFLGTEKYPDEHVYSSYLQTHGGGDNAFTSTQETNYYFHVEADYLENALDMFAWFFIDPLFTRNATGREMNAVNSEHEKNLQTDGWRLWQLLKHVSNPMHPFSQFSTGTIETLNKSNISEYLEKYYDTYYSANQMQLVVYSQQPPSTLRQWVNQSFSNVTNRNTTTPAFAPLTSFPQPSYTGKIVYYYPVADANSIVVYWQTIPLQLKYRNAISSFINRYLGDESKGSVLDFLRRRNWADGLSAANEVDTDTYSLLYVSVSVTPIGLPHVSEIVHTVFQYVRLLCSLSEQQLRELWEDFVTVNQLKFDHATKEEPSDYATNLAQTMRVTEDPADFLGNPKRLVFNISLISKVLSSLSPANSVLFLGSHMFNTSQPNATRQCVFMQESPVNLPWPELNNTEPIYGTYYREVPLPREVLHYWETDEQGVELSLPGTNPFVPENLDILTAPSNMSKLPVEVEMGEVGVSLWWLQDTVFKEPRVNIYCDITTSNAHSCPRWSAMSTLFVQLVSTVLQPYLYQSSELGYSYSLGTLPSGLSLSFQGFSDPDVMKKLVGMVANGLMNQSLLVDFSSYHLVAQAETENLRNYNYTTLPYRYITRYLQHVVMDRPYWKHWQLLKEVESLTLDDVLDHARKHLFTNATVLCFTEGNLKKEEAMQYTSIISGVVTSLRQDHAVGSYTQDRVQLAPGNYSVILQALNPQDLNSVINVVFQSESVCELEGSAGALSCSHDSLRTAVHLALLHLIIGEQCFFQLRTTEQLGYVVFCYSSSNAGQGSFQVVIQSIWADPEYLLERIDAFLTSYRDNIEAMTADEFEATVEVYKSTLLRRDLSLSEQALRLWSNYISTGLSQFDYSQQRIAVLDSVNATTLLEFYDTTVLDPATHRKMIIAVHGADDHGDVLNVTYPLDYASLNQTTLQFP